MSDFAELVLAWQPFYTLAGTAAATLIGLLFVAMSIRTEAFRRRTPTTLELFAALTFNCYFYVLLLAILFLIPRLSPPALGIPMAVLGLLGVVNGFIQHRRVRKYGLGGQGIALEPRFRLSIIIMALLMLLGVGVALRFEPSFYGIVVVIVLLLGSASQNVWALLIAREGPIKEQKSSEG